MSAELAPLSSSEIDRLAKFWWTCWVGMHWGFRRHAAVYWCCTGTISPYEAWGVLGIVHPHPLDVVIFYRELVRTQLPEFDLATMILEMTPEPERKQILRFCAGKAVFETGEGSGKSIAQIIDPVTRAGKLPKLRVTDDGPLSRVPSFRMIFEGLRRTTVMRGPDPPPEKSDTPLLFISADCPELISALPSLISTDPKNPEDVTRTGTIQDDIFEAAKNCYRDYPSIQRAEPYMIRRQKAIDSASDETGKRLNMLQFDHNNKQRRRVKRR